MPKSRGRKRRHRPSSGQQTRIVKLAPPVLTALKAQRQAFRKKFGRDPGPGDPVFFDPDEDTPKPYPPEKMRAETLEAMTKAGISPQIAYAYAKTGLLLMEEHQGNYPPEAIAEWKAAKRGALIRTVACLPKPLRQPRSSSPSLLRVTIAPSGRNAVQQRRVLL